MPIDDYFRSTPPIRFKPSSALKERWWAFQRLPHALQAEEIDELLRQAKERELNDEEFYIVKMWEMKRSPILN